MNEHVRWACANSWSMINCSLGFQRLIYSSSQVFTVSDDLESITVCDRDSEDSEEFEDVFDDETLVRNFTASRLENNVGGKCFFIWYLIKRFSVSLNFILLCFDINLIFDASEIYVYVLSLLDFFFVFVSYLVLCVINVIALFVPDLMQVVQMVFLLLKHNYKDKVFASILHFEKKVVSIVYVSVLCLILKCYAFY